MIPLTKIAQKVILSAKIIPINPFRIKRAKKTEMNWAKGG